MKRIISSAVVTALLFLTITGCTQTVAGNNQSSQENTNAEIVNLTATSYASAKALQLENKSITISNGGYYTLSGSIADGQVLVNTNEKVFIELAGVSVTNSKGPAIQVDNAKQVTLTLKKGTENSLADGGSSDINAALFTNDTLVIEGEGKLSVTGNYEHGIEGDDDIIINGGDITISAVNDGIHANDNITINGGKININKANEGIECKENDIVINGGEILVYAQDDAINAAKNITITGGRLYAQSQSNDAIDSNGTINISGGLVVAAGAMQPECGIDCDQSAPVITGGTVLAVGGGQSTPSATTTTQTTVQMGVNSSSGLMSLVADGKAIFTFESTKAYSTVLYSSPSLKQGTTYSIYTGGALTGGTGFAGYYEDGSYNLGEKVADFTTTAVVTVQGGSSGPGGGQRGGQRMKPNGEQMPPNGTIPPNRQQPTQNAA